MSDHKDITFTSDQLAERLGGRLVGRGDLRILGVNAIHEAGPREITFISDKRHARRWSESEAAGAVVTEGLELAERLADDHALIFVPDAELAVATILELYQRPEELPAVGTHPTAWVHEDTTLGEGVRIGPHVSIDRGCELGNGVTLHAGARLYAEVSIGERSVLHANCVVRQGCCIGRSVILHQNVSIGADGFGYRPAPDGLGLVKMPHIGTVIVHDGVEIGANSCVDRGKFGATVIGEGTKIDNLVQIAHNCRIGRCCVIAGGATLAGSAQLGDGVRMAGRVGVGEGVRIGNGVSVGAKSGVLRDIPAGQTYLGYPAGPAQETLRQWAIIRKLPGLVSGISGDAAGGKHSVRTTTGSD